MARALALLVAVGLLLAGCSAPAAPHRAPAGTSTDPDTLSGTVTVFAAASLTETFGTIAAAFEQEHPDVRVVLNLGGSSALAAQIASGAPADVFAAASVRTMTALSDAALTSGATTVFATNTLEIAVPAGNPGRVTGLSDFANPTLSIAICALEVPCGAASKAVFDAAGIVAAPDTFEQDVRAVLTRVELGEVDAGLVYKTDVIAAGDRVGGIEFPEAAAVIARYPIARLAESTHQDAAAAFIAFVLSAMGKKVLSDAGFGAP